MKYNKKFLLASFLIPLALAACKDNKTTQITLTVANPTETAFGPRTVEIPANSVLPRLGGEGFVVIDPSGNEIPSQLTYDSLIIFTANVAPGESKNYTIHATDSMLSYPATVWGDFYPQRRDDVAYENELVGFRLYGPGTQNAGERSYGFDLFLKHPTDNLVVPDLYAEQCSEENWKKVDSLRKIKQKLADEFIDSFTYHIDHGKGMDCYAVGSTLGAGAPALLENGSMAFPWCYEKAEILDNGPLRFTLAMQFAPKEVGTAKNVTEHRIISLDSRQHLNKTKVWYEGLDGDKTVVTGFPLRDESEVIPDAEAGIVAYADPTQGPNNGRALVGVVLAQSPDSIMFSEGHVLMARQLSPADTLSYQWGFAWDRTDITSLRDWKTYLDNAGLGYTVTVE